MSKVKVRALRPHDTVDGIKQPGEEYERTAEDAKHLSDRRIVQAVQTSTRAAAPKRAAKRK
jgi:hypothetical protein